MSDNSWANALDHNRVNYKESTASCSIRKASIIELSFSFLVLSFFIPPGNISDFWFLSILA